MPPGPVFLPPAGIGLETDRDWPILTRMNLVRLTALLIYTYGAFSYGAMFLFWLRQVGRASWAGQRTQSCGPNRSMDLVGGAISLLSFLWFAGSLLLVLINLDPGISQWPLQTVMLILVFLFPPLIAHTTYVEVGGRTDPPLTRPWRLALGALYLAAVSVIVFSLLGFYRMLPLPRGVPGRVAGVSLGILFSLAGIYSLLAISRRGARPKTASEQTSRRWWLVLFVALFLMGLPITLANAGWVRLSDVMEVGMRSLPLAFLFAGTYFDNRFEFFDLFIKRGLALLVTIVLFTAYFALVPPRLEGFPLDWARPWVYALTLLPIGIALPWIYRALGRWLDNIWLGRQFSTVEAVKHFLSGIQSAVTEEDLVRRAEAGIGEIMHASVRVVLRDAPAPEPRAEARSGVRAAETRPEMREQTRPELRVEVRQELPAEDRPDVRVEALPEAVLEIPIGRREPAPGAIRLGKRASQVPYFGQDVILLESLAEVFAYMLENIRLQQKKQQQEQREKELSLHASRSELKALRAQINPHFLFNALNAIAGLIPKDPARADRAVEQLAEVFRYTLRRSESEWSRLGDEMEAVRAYLELEQARFGQRLQCRVTVDPQAEDARIPTLVVQTLVENAVKHGVAAIRGPGLIEVEAIRKGNRLEIRVADNGPGFPAEEPEHPDSPGASGFGLKNIRDRLRGHFGEHARLEIARDASGQKTVVSLSLPTAVGQGESIPAMVRQERE